MTVFPGTTLTSNIITTRSQFPRYLSLGSTVCPDASYYCP